MAMAASKIVAEPLTITGSIGVVTGKFNLEELYRRVQYSKVVISKGRSACCLQAADLCILAAVCDMCLGSVADRED